MSQLALFELEASAPLPVANKEAAALALLPFATISNGEPRNQPITVAHQLHVDGKLRRINLTLRPGAGLDLPNQNDQMVYLGLLQLAMQEEPAASRLHFRRSQLMNLLGWGKDGRSYDRLRASLERLTGYMITVNSAFVAVNGREYGQGQQSAHLIDRYDIEGGYDAECWVEWGSLVREAMAHDDFKVLNWRLCRQLENPLTVQFYRVLDRCVLSGQTEWEVGWKPLAQSLGMTTNYARPARFRSLLEPHIAALIDRGVIDHWEYARGGKFVFAFPRRLRSAVREALIEAGVFPDAAAQLVASVELSEILAQLQALVWTEPGKRPRAPGGYLVDAIRKRYELRLPDDAAQQFQGLLDLCLPAERDAYLRCAAELTGESTEPPYTDRLVAVGAALICRSIDPEMPH